MYTHLDGHTCVLCMLCLCEIERDLTHDEYQAKYRNRNDLCEGCQENEDRRKLAQEGAGK